MVMSSVDDVPVSLVESRSGSPIATGATVSMMIDLEFATFVAGRVTDVIAFPAESTTVPIAKLATVRSAEFCPDATV